MKRDSDFVCFTRQVKIPRADIVTVQPRARGGARVFTKERSKLGVLVLEDYAVVMERVYGGGGAVYAPVARPVRGLSELAAQFQEKDEVLAQILLALRRFKGVFNGSAGDLSRAISESMDEASRHFFNPRRVGGALSGNWKLLQQFLMTHAPRLLHGRTIYRFCGLQAGVEL